MRVITNVVGFDDAPFARDHRGEVMLVGAVCSRTRLDGVLSGRVQRDGTDSTRRMVQLVSGSQFTEHVRAVLLQGIAVAGFNVVDVEQLHEELGVPVLVVARRPPDLEAMRVYLEHRVRGARRKWRLIRAAGPMEPMRGIWVQRTGIGPRGAEQLLAATTLHGKIPEPLRLAHLIAGGVTAGKSRGRV
jgi:endonuclease V-like protein UPF0215 family